MTGTDQGNSALLRSIVLLTVMLGGGIAIAGLLYAVRTGPPRRALTAQAPMVEIMVVQAEDVVERFVGYGTARPDRMAKLAAEVVATVVERVGDIEAGSLVGEGQLLLRLDDREYRYRLERTAALADADRAALDELGAEAEGIERLLTTAENELRVAHDERSRLGDLFERKLAAKKEYDFANLAYQRARRVLQGYQLERSKIDPRQAALTASMRGHQAEAELAGLDLERCEIRAPFAGTIQSITVDTGDRANPGSILVTLLDPLRVEIPLQLPASVYDRVHTGAACRIESESMSQKVWGGRVARIAPSVDENTRTFAVYVEVDNSTQSHPLVPGTFVQAEIRGPEHRNCLVIPRRAIRSDHILVVEDGVAQRRSVAVDRLIADRAVVSGDLRNGDQVILSYLAHLTHGSPVRVRSALTAFQGPDIAVGTGASP